MRFRLKTLLVGIIFVALILALIVQRRQHAAREAELRKFARDIMTGTNTLWAEHLIGDLFSKPGLTILKSPTKVEGLEVVSREEVLAKGMTGEAVRVYPVRPSDKELGLDFASRLSSLLLEKSNYVSADDWPDPEVGVRLWKDKNSLDLLFSTDRSKHTDVWVYLWNEHGELVHQSGYQCLSNPTLARLIASTLASGKNRRP